MRQPVILGHQVIPLSSRRMRFVLFAALFLYFAGGAVMFGPFGKIELPQQYANSIEEVEDDQSLPLSDFLFGDPLLARDSLVLCKQLPRPTFSRAVRRAIGHSEVRLSRGPPV